MGDFAPLPAIGGSVLPVRAVTDPQAAMLAPVAASSDSRGAQARMDTSPQATQTARRAQGGTTEEERGPKAPTRFDEFVLVGPTPAFQANVLELERDLQRTIERLESERARVEADAAMKIERAERRADAAEARNTKPEATPEPEAAIDEPAVAEPAPKPAEPVVAEAAEAAPPETEPAKAAD